MRREAETRAQARGRQDLSARFALTLARLISDFLAPRGFQLLHEFRRCRPSGTRSVALESCAEFGEVRVERGLPRCEMMATECAGGHGELVFELGFETEVLELGV